jgi:hypothetical protein
VISASTRMFRSTRFRPKDADESDDLILRCRTKRGLSKDE